MAGASGNYTVVIEAIVEDRKLKDQLAKAGKSAGKSMGKGLTASADGMIANLGRAMKRKLSYGAFRYGTMAIKGMVDSVRELDKAQTQLSKVTDLQGKTMDEFTEKAFEAGKAVSRTGTEMVTAATLFAQAGMKDQALELGKVATMYQNIADEEVSINDATGMIVATMKAFDMSSVEDAMGIINVINEVSNNFAVSSSDLATNINKSTAAAKNAGMTYQELVSSMAGMIEITRSGAKASRAVVTLSSRYAQMTDSASSTGAKLTEFYDSLGIKTRDADGQLIDFYKVLEQMGEKWGELDDDQKKYYANIQAGANQSQNLLALLNNWKNVGGKGGIMDTAMQSWNSDSAEKANENYMNSLEGKINGLKSAWQKLSSDFMNSDFLKGLITIATKLLEIADNIGVVGTMISLAFGYKALFSIASLMESVGTLGGMLSALGVPIAGVGTAVAEVGEVAEKSAEGATASTLNWSKAFGVLKANIVPIASGLLAIGAIVAAIKIGDYLSLDKSLERLHEYEDELDEVEGKIEELEQKSADGSITQGELQNLKTLKLEKRELEDLIKLEQKRAGNAARQMLKDGSGKAGQERAGTENSAKFDIAQEKYIKYQEEYNKKYAEYLSLLDKRKKIEDAGGDTGDVDSQIRSLNDSLHKLDEAMTQAEVDMDKYGRATLEDWQALMDAGATYQNMIAEGASQKEIANYQAVRNTVLQTMLDNDKLKESYGEVASSASAAFDIFESSITVKDIDLSGVEDSAQAIDKIFEGVVDNQEITFTAVDETGKTIMDLKAEKDDLTKEEWEMIINAQKTGDWSEVEKWKDGYKGEAEINFVGNDTDAKKKKNDLEKPANPRIDFQSNIGNIKKDKADVTKSKSGIKLTFSSNLASIASKIKSLASSAGQIGHFATGKSKGQAGGLAWLGDEGSSSNPKPEMVVTKDGAYLAGTSGWELHNISDSDIVYSYAETKKLLGGRLATSGNKMIPRYAKGKSSKQKKQDEYDTKLETLEYKRDVEHWTDAKYEAEYKKLYDSYSKYLSTEQLRDRGRAEADYKHDTVTNTIEGLIDAVAENGKAQGAIDAIKKAQEAKKISEDEAKELRAKAYEEQIEYYARETKAGRKSYEELYKVAETYWKEVGKDTKEYYDSLDKLRDASEEKLKAQQERQEDELSYGEQYVKLQIAQLEKQKEINDKQKEQMDDAQSLVDLQNELSKARATMVRVFKEGVGWVYESDMNAIKDAQKALDEYYEEHSEDSIDAEIERWQAIADLFGDIKDQSELYALAQKLGVNSLADLVNGDVRDVQTMSDWIKSHDVWLNAYDDMIAQLDNMSAEQYAGIANTGVTKESMDALFDKYNFTDVLNTTNFQDALSSGISSALSPLLYNIRDNNKGTVDSNNDKSTIINIGDITLPNVTNSEEFVTGLKTLAIQYAYK